MRRPGKLRPLLLIFLVGVAGWGLWYSRSTAPKGKVILDQDVDDYFLYAFDTKKPVVCFSLESQAKCTRNRASEWNEIGVSAMEKYLEGPLRDLVHYNNNFLEDAFEYFQKATSDDPDCPRPWVNLGIVQMLREAEKDALASLNTALSLHESPDYYAIRGFVYELLGNMKQARLDWGKAEQLNPLISERRYIGMMLTNDTRSWQRNIFPLIKESHHPVESNSVRKALAFVEFSRISISDYGIVPPHEVNSFREQKYLVLRKLIPPYLLAVMQANYETMQLLKKIPLGDTVSDRRYAIYNDRLSVFLHYKITDKLRRIISHNAIPSYSYYGGYIAGSTLPPHTDRHQCEFTLSLCILQRPVDKPWPLSLSKTPKFERNNSAEYTLSVSLFEGDALLFMGRHLVHFREGTLEDDEITSNLFLHWVQDDFDATLD